MVGRRKVISRPHRWSILLLTTLPSTFRLPRGSRTGGHASPAMWDAIAWARRAASFLRHSLEREGDTASRIRSLHRRLLLRRREGGGRQCRRPLSPLHDPRHGSLRPARETGRGITEASFDPRRNRTRVSAWGRWPATV